MSDDRLFASNNPIGRKWYFINILLIAIITAAIYFGMTKGVIPNVTNNDYIVIGNWILNIAMFICAITFFSLIDRRLYDVSGSRDKGIYKSLAPVLTFIVLFVVIVVVFNVYPTVEMGGRDLSLPLEIFNPIAILLSFVFAIIVFVIGLKKGKKTKQ